MFNANGRYVLVTGMPTTVCRDCGERSFSRKVTERTRQLVHDPPEDTDAKRVFPKSFRRVPIAGA